MPRLRNSATGAVVSVSDETAALLSGYEPVEDPKPTASTKKSSSKSDK